MIILSIDPGDKLTAWTLVNLDTLEILGRAKQENREVELQLFQGYFTTWGDLKTMKTSGGTEEIRELIRLPEYELVAIEYPHPRGESMYTQLVDAIRWIGRYEGAHGADLSYIDRKDVKMTLCGRCVGVGDSNIRAALLSRYPATGGGKIGQVGTKKLPGPLFGVSKDMWAALGVAITWNETKRRVYNMLK
jgi:hypothetical protein